MQLRGIRSGLVGLTIIAIAVAACSSSAPPSSGAPGATAAPATAVAPSETGSNAGKTITWATIAGFYTDIAKQRAAEFTAQTGVNVNIVEIDLQSMYDKEVLDMAGGTGAYDIVTWNLSWLGQWAENGWVEPLDSYIAKDDATLKLDDIAPILVTQNKWKGMTYGLPYYTFTQGMFYRCDLFEDPAEQAAFQSTYGYALDVPTTYEQMADMAQFFRRKAGDTLKGEAVSKDFYGIGLMDGRVNNIFDEANMIAWPMGGDVINDDGTPGVTSKAYLDALHLNYDKMLPYAPPGSLNGGYDFVVGQFNSGLIAMTGPFYLDQWANAVKVETQVPGAEACAAPHPGGGKTWAGAFDMGVTAASKNKDAAWQFLSYLVGPEAQMKFALAGGSTPRLSILNDRALAEANRATMGHFPVLANILDDANKNWYTNFIWVPQAAKIYNDAPKWFSAAASGQSSIEDAMNGFAASIKEICGGNCQIENSGVTKPAPGDTYTFDKSLQIRKP